MNLFCEARRVSQKPLGGVFTLMTALVNAIKIFVGPQVLEQGVRA